MASTFRCPATTMRRGRSRSIAISWPRRRSTASRGRKASSAPNAARAKMRSSGGERREPVRGGFQPLSGPRGVADDLKKLAGVSPAIEKMLNDLGIFHFLQIAEFTPEATHKIGEEVGLPGRVEGWIAQAKQFTAE